MCDLRGLVDDLVLAAADPDRSRPEVPRVGCRSTARWCRGDWLADPCEAEDDGDTAGRRGDGVARAGASDSNAIKPHASKFVPSRGRKYPTRCPPQRGMIRPQFSEYSLKASR